MSDESKTAVSEAPAPPRSPMSTAHWRELYAFGLPAGSVRALLALSILGTTAALIVLRPHSTIPDAFRDLTFLILGHYFALRRTAHEPEQAGPAPLFLPRGTVRFLIFAGFLTAIVLLMRRPRPLSPRETPAIYTLIVVVGFLLGVIFSTGVRWLWERGHRPKRIWADLRALLTLLACIVLLLLAWNEAFHFLPALRENLPDAPTITGEAIWHILAGVVAFYFGIRS